MGFRRSRNGATKVDGWSCVGVMAICLTAVFGCGEMGKGGSLLGLRVLDDSWALWW